MGYIQALRDSQGDGLILSLLKLFFVQVYKEGFLYMETFSKMAKVNYNIASLIVV